MVTKIKSDDIYDIWHYDYGGLTVIFSHSEFEGKFTCIFKPY